MHSIAFIRLSIRGLALVLLFAGLAACQETPTGPGYLEEERQAETATTLTPDDARVALHKLGEHSNVTGKLYKDAISFIPGSVTLWPNQTITAKVEVQGTMPRIGPLSVKVAVPMGLSVDGGGSGVDQVVTIPAGAKTATFQLTAFLGGGQVRQLKGTAPRYRPGTMSVRTEHPKLADVFREKLDLDVNLKEQEPWWWLKMTPTSAQMQVCDVETITVERFDIGWQIFDLEVLLNVPAGLSVSGPTVQQTGNGPVLTISTGTKRADFQVRADAGSHQSYVVTASATAFHPADVTIDVAVPGLSLAPSSETILVGQTKSVTLAHTAGTCAAVPVTMSAAAGLGIAGGASGSAQTVTIPAGASSTSVDLHAVHAGGSPYTVSASGGAFATASMAVSVPQPALQWLVVGSAERTVHWGQSATYTLEVSGTNWFNQAIELETRGTLPDGVSATFNPAQVTLSPMQPSQQVTLTLATVEGETELYSQNNDRPREIDVRATPVGFHSLARTAEVELSVLRTNGAFTAFGMSSSTVTHPSGVVGEVSGGYLNFRYDGHTDGPYHPFFGFGISSQGRVGVVHDSGSPGVGSGSQTHFVNLGFPQRGFGTDIWSSQNSNNGYSASWYYSPDNSIVVVAARDCVWAGPNNNGVCNDASVPLVVTVIDAVGGAIGQAGIGQSALSGSAIHIESNGTEQTVVLTKSNGQTETWELSD